MKKEVIPKSTPFNLIYFYFMELFGTATGINASWMILLGIFFITKTPFTSTNAFVYGPMKSLLTENQWGTLFLCLGLSRIIIRLNRERWGEWLIPLKTYAAVLSALSCSLWVLLLSQFYIANPNITAVPSYTIATIISFASFIETFRFIMFRKRGSFVIDVFHIVTRTPRL